MPTAAPTTLVPPEARVAQDALRRTASPDRGVLAGPGAGGRPDRSAPRPDPFAGAALTSPARRARRLAWRVHRGQVARDGGPMVEHVERVAAAVPQSARTVAFVHDVCERSGIAVREVAQRLGLDRDEREALTLLSKPGREPLARQVRRILREPAGPASELALLVLRADLEDHAAHAPDGPAAYAPVLGLLDAATTSGTRR